MDNETAGADGEAVEDEEVMTDADFERAMEQLREEGGEDVNELLMAMSENRIISWEEAEHILGNSTNEPVKSSLPQQTRPTEPDNDTDVDWCVQRLMNNDPKLVEINLNNMKRTPIPKIKRVIEACRDNEHMEKLSLANMGLYDTDVQPLIDILEHNTTLRCINLETNYLSGDFFARLFKAALTNQTLEEVKAVNQGVAFSTTSEREIIEAITQNRGLTKVSINLRLPEGRFKIEKATIRNQEIRRILRRQEAAAQAAAAEKAKGPLTTRPPKEAEAKRMISELARKANASKLAVAGATEQPKAGSSSVEKPMLREKARDMEREAMKPKETNTAEKVLLSQRLRETGVESGVAARRAKFGDKAAEPAGEKRGEKAAKTAPDREEKKAQQTTDGTAEKSKFVPSWREKLADRDAKAKELTETATVKSNNSSSKNRTTKANATPNKETEQRKESKDTTAQKVPKKAKPKEEGTTVTARAEKTRPEMALKSTTSKTTASLEKTKPETALKSTAPAPLEKTKPETALKSTAPKTTAPLEKTKPETAPKAMASWRDLRSNSSPMDSSEGEESCSSTKGEKRGAVAAEQRMPGELFDRRHFHEHFDTDAYLKDFYARVDDAAMQMVLFHLPNIVARLGPLPSLLDFGSGPTIHVAVCFRHTAEEIYLADYLPQNRDELCQWLSEQSKFDWSTVMRIIAAREAVPLSEIRQMEQKAREKIRAVLFCDCHSFPSVQIPDKIRRDKTFSAITTFFTLEYCCLSSYEYALAINHLSAHLAPDGVLIMGGVLEETWCAFGGRQFKCLFVSRKLMMECLRGAGLILERDQLDNELFYELDGMYILVARKMAE
ncbi:hypothetical protein niasHT_038099 [Heterodera trifolii]|uniref:Uncharacterized protein n=1 Tax=Heterodera trifolii TaxID=157864 RepID=A0ABD2HNL2_9BILA